jgi:ankyrin repeat protein
MVFHPFKLKFKGTTKSKKSTSHKSVLISVVFSLLFIALLAGCKNKDTYKREIEQKGMSYSVESFLNTAAAGYKETVALFLKAGTDINTRGAQGETALMLAAVNHNIDLLKFLVKNTADVNAKNNDGYTALMFVASQGNVEVAEFLIAKGADMNTQNNVGETALMLSVLHSHIGMTKMLIEKGADVHVRNIKGNRAIEYAFLNSQIKELLRNAMAKK